MWRQSIEPAVIFVAARFGLLLGRRSLRIVVRSVEGQMANYNTYRTHLGLDKGAPLGRPVQDHGKITPMPKLGGLHHAYIRI